MEFLSQPSRNLWIERRNWFENKILNHEGMGSYLMSEQANALVGEVQVCFCAGAWISVIVMAFTVIDAHLRETELSGVKCNSKELLDLIGFDQKYQRLRLRRNQIIHLQEDHPAITVDQQWHNRHQLEAEARATVNLMMDALFSNPGV